MTGGRGLKWARAAASVRRNAGPGLSEQRTGKIDLLPLPEARPALPVGQPGVSCTATYYC